MGKRRKGSNKRDGGLAGLKNAVSDDEGGVVGEDGVLGEVEQWENDEDQRILGNVQLGRRRKDDGGAKEVFALSGTDSDSDLELPDIKKMRKQKFKKRNKGKTKFKKMTNNKNRKIVQKVLQLKRLKLMD